MKIGNVEVYGIIYKITNKVNGKVYIGQTIKGFDKRYNSCGSGIERVYNYHMKNKKNKKSYNDHLLNSIKKYGLESFEVIKVLDIAFSRIELDIKEKHYIDLYKSCNESFGYNKTLGGEGISGYEYTETQKQKMSENHADVSGKNNPMYGKLGKLSPHYGKKRSKETCSNISNSLKGKQKSKEHKRNLSKSRIEKGCAKGKNNPSAKSVICLTTKRIFFTIQDAMKKYNISGTNDISKSIKRQGYCGKYKNKKLKWKFLIWNHNKSYRIKRDNNE